MTSASRSPYDNWRSSARRTSAIIGRERFTLTGGLGAVGCAGTTTKPRLARLAAAAFRAPGLAAALGTTASRVATTAPSLRTDLVRTTVFLAAVFLAAALTGVVFAAEDRVVFFAGLAGADLVDEVTRTFSARRSPTSMVTPD